MRTVVEVTARRGPGGRTDLAVIRATGQLAVRRTGEHRIHLVATAFGPLGGDAAIVSLRVEEGARLQVGSVAAAVCQPSRDASPSRAELYAEVAPGAQLEVLLEPTVVATGAQHHARTEVMLADGGRLRITERVVLGRHAEGPGQWSGTTRVVRAGRPLVHSCVELGPGSPVWRPPTTPRAYATDLVLERQPPAVAAGLSRTGSDALLLPLPGGSVSTAWGERLEDVLARIADLAESTS